MHVIAGVLVIAALFGFGIYKAFIDPTYVVNVGESIQSTEACVEGTPDLEINRAVTDEVNELADPPGLVVQDTAAEAAVIVFFLSSETDAVAARGDLAAEIAGELGAAFGDDVTQRGTLVLAHPGVTLENVATAHGPCLFEISDNKWGAWSGFETKTIGRPFAADE